MLYAPLAVGNGLFTVIDAKYWAELQAMGDWFVTGFGYACVKFRKKNTYLHKWVYAQIDPIYQGLVDHIDTNRLNNIGENLRPATQSEQIANTNLWVTSTSGIKGVAWHSQRGKWRAYIVVDYVQEHIGLFDKFEDAVAARQARAIQVFGDRARETEI